MSYHGRKIFLTGIIKQLKNEVRFLSGDDKKECEEEIEELERELKCYL